MLKDCRSTVSLIRLSSSMCVYCCSDKVRLCRRSSSRSLSPIAILGLLFIVAILIFSCSIKALAQCSLCQADTQSNGLEVRIEAGGDDSVRLRRVYVEPVMVSSLPENFSRSWWLNLSRPNFCRMVLCHGTCGLRADAEFTACRLKPLYPILKLSTDDGATVSGCEPYNLGDRSQ